MSNSVLVRIPVAPGGMLLDDQDAWHVGPVDARGDGLGGEYFDNLAVAKQKKTSGLDKATQLWDATEHLLDARMKKEK